MFEPLITAFILIFLSEMIDKTQILILGIAMHSPKHGLQLFLGTVSAHALADGIAIVIGALFGKFIFSIPFLSPAIGVLFIILGVWSLFNSDDHLHHMEKIKKAPFMATFLLVFAAEMGDKSQITAGLVAAQYQSIPLIQNVALVFTGTILALAAAALIAITLGKSLTNKVPTSVIGKIVAVVFIIFGILKILTNF